jgi:CHU_C Type IX secretion signal domain
MRLKNIFLLFAILYSIVAPAQVLPPEIKCVQNDTVKWNLPNNTCGAFVSYLVYGSKNFSGPYTLIQAVTNQAQKSFYHSHPKNETWFYFLQSKFNCPGQPIISSDTLTGSSPELPTIQSVSVENGAVEVNWTPSKSKNVTGYIVYKQTSLGIKPFDTLFNALKFIDKKVMPDKQREVYYILALDRCGNTSLFGKAHATIQSKATQNACERSAKLSWNKYRSWQNGTLRHEVWVRQGTGNYALADTIAAKDTTFNLKNLKDKEKYCFYVKSIQRENPTYFSKTNETCITGDIVQPTDFILVKNLNIDTKGEASFTWTWNNDADLDSIKIKKSTDGKTYKDIASLPVKNLAGEVTFVDKTAPVDSNTVNYGIYALDKCGNFAFAPFNTLNIKGSPLSNGVNKISWTNHYTKGVKDTDFELYKVVKGAETQIWTTTNQNEFNDKFDPANDDNAYICYYVVAYAFDTLPNGKVVKVRSRSNTVCVGQTSGVFVPNAFSPYGANQEFRPLVSFSNQIKEYLMMVFDRNGAKIFESRSFDKGWNGKIDGNGDNLPQGVYAYYLKIVQSNDKVIENKGTVFLLR